MKKNICLILLLTSSLFYSQDCKYQRNEVDQFTKNKVVETKFEWLAEQTGYSLLKVDSVKFLKLYVESFKVFSIKDGAKLMFLTDKEEPITIVFPKYDISKRGTSSEFYISETITLSDEDFKRFQNEKITKVRYYTTEGYIEKNIKEKRANKFRESLKCIE